MALEHTHVMSCGESEALPMPTSRSRLPATLARRPPPGIDRRRRAMSACFGHDKRVGFCVATFPRPAASRPLNSPVPIAQCRRTRHVRVAPYKHHRFSDQFTHQDRLLLAEVDEAYDHRPAPRSPPVRSSQVRSPFPHLSCVRLAACDTAWRAANHVRRQAPPMTSRYGERQRPESHGDPSRLRVDSVHQGD
jgi:hypothetical protein